MRKNEDEAPSNHGIDEDEDDFVNIAFLNDGGERREQERTDFSSVSGDGEYYNDVPSSTGDENYIDERKPAAVVIDSVGASTTEEECNHYEDDRKPAAGPPSRAQNKDARFMCAICLDEVSDEPVVTKCGHLYCWPCLYQWLSPGMLVKEYYAAFGGGGGGGIGRASNHGGSRGNLNNFISEMATPSNESDNRPYDQSRWNTQRRVCPVCKSFCTVDSVIPIYINAHVGALSQGDREECFTTQPLQQSSQIDEQNSDENSNVGNAHSEESPLSAVAFDPTTANLGLRQRRSTTPSTSSAINNSAHAGLCNSPPQTSDLYENIPSNATNTPVIRNGGGNNIAVPNRPFPTLAPLNSGNNRPDVQTPTSQHHRAQNATTAAPVLNDSSFRLAYRPRHVDYSQSIQFPNRQMGGLMGIVSGFVHSIDNIGAANQHGASHGSTRDQSEVPQLHRSDNGLGGIGRASEWNSERNSVQVDGNTEGASGMGGGDSSLALAQEFLSRLLFMLACFVVLCLLLF